MCSPVGSIPVTAVKGKQNPKEEVVSKHIHGITLLQQQSTQRLPAPLRQESPKHRRTASAWIMYGGLKKVLLPPKCILEKDDLRVIKFVCLWLFYSSLGVLHYSSVIITM